MKVDYLMDDAEPFDFSLAIMARLHYFEEPSKRSFKSPLITSLTHF